MANQQEQQIMAAFIQWLPKNIAKFQGQIPDEIITPIANAKDENEIVNVLNQLSQSEEGNQLVAGMFQAFQQELSEQTGMFKKGGKLGYLLEKTGIIYANEGVKLRRRDAMKAAMSSGLTRYGARKEIADARARLGRIGGIEEVYNKYTHPKEKNIITSYANEAAKAEADAAAAAKAEADAAAAKAEADAAAAAKAEADAAAAAKAEADAAALAKNRNDILVTAYNEIMKGKWGNGHEARQAHWNKLENTYGLTYDDLKNYVNKNFVPPTNPPVTGLKRIGDSSNIGNTTTDRYNFYKSLGKFDNLNTTDTTTPKSVINTTNITSTSTPANSYNLKAGNNNRSSYNFQISSSANSYWTPLLTQYFSKKYI